MMEIMNKLIWLSNLAILEYKYFLEHREVCLAWNTVSDKISADKTAENLRNRENWEIAKIKKVLRNYNT